MFITWPRGINDVFEISVWQSMNFVITRSICKPKISANDTAYHASYSGLKSAQPNITKFCTRCDSVTTVTCAKFVMIGRPDFKPQHYTTSLNFEFSNSIEISLVGRPPGHWRAVCNTCLYQVIWDCVKTEANLIDHVDLSLLGFENENFDHGTCSYGIIRFSGRYIINWEINLESN